MPTERIIKVGDLSRKDVKISDSVVRVKDGAYNIRSNNGANDLAPFNSSLPLNNWPKPVGAKTGAIVHVLFSDGLAYFTYNGTTYVLDFFYASQSFVYEPIIKVLSISVTFEGMGTPQMLLNFPFYNSTGVDWEVTNNEDPYTLVPSNPDFIDEHILFSNLVHFTTDGGISGVEAFDVFLDGVEKTLIFTNGSVSIGNTYNISLLFIKKNS